METYGRPPKPLLACCTPEQPVVLPKSAFEGDGLPKRLRGAWENRSIVWGPLGCSPPCRTSLQWTWRGKDVALDRLIRWRDCETAYGDVSVFQRTTKKTSVQEQQKMADLGQCLATNTLGQITP